MVKSKTHSSGRWWRCQICFLRLRHRRIEAYYVRILRRMPFLKRDTKKWYIKNDEALCGIGKGCDRRGFQT